MSVIQRICILFFLTARVCAWSYHDEAILAEQKGDTARAHELISRALVDNPTDKKLLYDAGVLAYKQQKFDQAYAYFSHAHESDDALLKEQALFNSGNTCVKQNKLQEAIDRYEDVLALNEKNEKARHNLEKVKEMLKQQEQEKKQQEDQQKKQEDKKNQNQKKDQNKNQQNDSQDNQQDESDKQDSQQQENEDTAENENSQENGDQDKSPENKHGKDKQQKADQKSKEKDQQQNQQSQEQDEKDSQQQQSGKQSEQQSEKKGNREKKQDSQLNQGRSEQPQQEEKENERADAAASGQNGGQEDEQEGQGVAPAPQLDAPLAGIMKDTADADAQLNKQLIKAIVDQQKRKDTDVPSW